MAKKPTYEPIAIIGIGCTFPGGASTPKQLWQLLSKGFDAIVDVPLERWDPRRFYCSDPQTPGKMVVNKGGFLQQPIDTFDATFFKISSREADSMDPQQRLLLETSWKALEDGGLVPSTLKGSKAGVFVGAFTTDWQTLNNHLYNVHLGDIYSGINASQTILSARLSHFYDLKGPCLTIDTACSSSLVAVHLACESLWKGESTLALAGGINAILVPNTSLAMSKGRFLNPNGQCRSFDADGKGYTRGEGAGIVLLKPLSKAIEEGNSIYALIRGTGINHDGYTNGIAMPNPDAQRQLILEVLDKASVSPKDIQYIEAHGTGTPAGDPAEAWAIDQALHQSINSKHRCYMGSIKSNMGHLEAAAGVAGLIKAALCLKHKAIPQNLHFDNPNPHIPFKDNHLIVPTALSAFPNPNKTLYAGVNSFGYGGTNAHVVLEEYCDRNAIETDSTQKIKIFPLSAHSEEALFEMAAILLDFIEKEPSLSLEDLSYTLINHRERFDVQATFLAKNGENLCQQLDLFCRKDSRAAPVSRLHLPATAKIAFIYTGMGPQWHAMGRELYQTYSVFKNTLERCSDILKPLAGWSLVEELHKSEEESKIHLPQYAQPANFSLQIALTELLESFGIKPKGICGHSIGEVAAAVVSRALTLEEGILISYHRSRIQAKTQGMGKMLAAESSQQMIDYFLDKHHDRVFIAAKNSPNSFTLSGDEDSLKAITEHLDTHQLFHRFLTVDIAYHSGQMNPFEQEVIQSLGQLCPNAPVTPLYSTVDHQILSPVLDAAYWWKNIRQTVCFQEAIERMIDEGYNTFIEIGPHPVLAKSIKEIAQAKNARILSFHTLNRKDEEASSILKLLGTLSHLGYPHGANSLLSATSKYISLPPYPWQKKKHWIESEASSSYHRSQQGHPYLSQRCQDTPYEAWKVEVNEGFFPWLHDHKIDGATLFPGAGYIEAGLIIHQQLNNSTACILEDISFTHPLTVLPSKEPLLRLSKKYNSPNYEVHSLSSPIETTWTLHASGTILPPWKNFSPTNINLLDLKSRCKKQFHKQEIYSYFQAIGLEYGPSFQLIQHLWTKDGESISELEQISGDEDYILPPPLLDAAFQTLLGTALSSHSEEYIPIPIGIKTFHLYEKPKGPLYCYAKAVSQNDRIFSGDLTLCSEDGRVFLHAKEVKCQLLKVNKSNKNTDPLNLLYSVEWTPCINPPKTLTSKVIVFQTQHSSHELDPSACHDLIRLVKENEAALSQDPYTLYIITHGVYSNQNAHHISDSLIWGLGRVIRNEYPHIDVRLLDIDDPSSNIKELISKAPDNNELLFKENTFYTPSLNKIEKPFQLTFSPKVHTQHQIIPYTLEFLQAGAIENLFFRQRYVPNLRRGQVKIAVHTASLNFKDLMKVLGLLNEEALKDTYFGNTFGMECSGTIIEVGPGANKWKVGDKVIAFGREAISSQIIVDSHALCPIPNGLTMTESPSLIAFITVLQGLKEIAKLKRGETVLIHTATGAVGLAAVQYAQHIGAHIIATAGSEEKRAHLIGLGITHIADSRSTRFYEQVLEWTNGKGVDVVLNALSGEALQKSWQLLAPYGRFIEIGKRDITENSLLPMATFNKNALFAAIDLDRTFADDKSTIHKLIKHALKYFERGIFKPLPHKLFKASSIQEAFTFFARAKHIGKVMITFDDEEIAVSPPLNTRPLFNKENSYLITGGLSGFGLATAEWMGANGAKDIILLSRSGKPTKEAIGVIKKMKRQGIKVTPLACDVGEISSLKLAFEAIENNHLPLKGIFHAATVLEDAFISDLTPSRFDSAIHGKAKGAWNLHQLTQHLALDYFVLYSSISSLIGNPGQGNYCAANAFLDYLSSYRRSQKLPSLTVNWGAIGEIGLLSRDPRVASHLNAQGIQLLNPETCFKALDFLLRLPAGQKEQFALIDIDWKMLFSALPTLENTELLHHFKQLATEQSHSDMKKYLVELDPNSRLSSLVDYIRNQVATILRVDPKQIDTQAKLNTVGMDSLMAMELQHEMEQKLAIKIPTMELVRGPTIHELSHSLMKKILC